MNKAHHVPYIYLSQDDKQQQELIEIINSAGQIYENQNLYFELEITAKYYKAIKWLLLHSAVVNEQKRYYFDYRIKRLMTFYKVIFTRKFHYKC